ncbi:hypothetical protein BDW67DRAFT_151018 [Aspergillus spinulosporus]
MRRSFLTWDGLLVCPGMSWTEIEDREVRSIRKMLCHLLGELVAAQLHPAGGGGLATTLELVTVSLPFLFAMSYCWYYKDHKVLTPRPHSISQLSSTPSGER